MRRTEGPCDDGAITMSGVMTLSLTVTDSPFTSCLNKTPYS